MKGAKSSWHKYWLDASNQRRMSRQSATVHPRVMHVSPFTWTCTTIGFFSAPGERLVAHMNTLGAGQVNFRRDARVGAAPGERRELHGVLAAYRLMTLRGIGAIHWEALKLWAKGTPAVFHPGKIENEKHGVAVAQGGPRVAAAQKEDLAR